MREPKYNMHLKISGLDLFPGMTLDQIEPNIEELYKHMKESNDINNGIFKEQEWVAGYATVYSRKAVNDIGLFDTKFNNGCEDLDFCKRLKNKGYKIGQSLDSFVFHFGGVSRGAYKLENKENYVKEDQINHIYLNNKWGKKSVMIYSGPSWEKWDFRNLETTGIGGSEVWQIWLSRELSKLGYRVTCFADCSTRMMDGEVTWIPYTEYPTWMDQNWTDYAILSRTTDPLRFPLRAGKVFIQIHDVWMLSDKNQLFLDRVNKFCALSQWHLDFASNYHGIPKDKMAITSNGIDLKRFDDIKVERNPYRFHWSSSLDRGLDNLLYLWPFIKKEIPEAVLHVYYGILNWKESCKLRNDQEGLKKIDDLEVLMKQPGVFNHGRKNQKELAEEICKASVLLYPTAFSETWFITGIECQYAGVPIITNNYAGLITTLGSSAIMLGTGEPYWPYSEEGRKQFLAETISLLKDQEKWKLWSDKGRENAKKFSWANCALRWKVLFEE